MSANELDAQLVGVTGVIRQVWRRIRSQGGVVWERACLLVSRVAEVMHGVNHRAAEPLAQQPATSSALSLVSENEPDIRRGAAAAAEIPARRVPRARAWIHTGKRTRGGSPDRANKRTCQGSTSQQALVYHQFQRASSVPLMSGSRSGSNASQEDSMIASQPLAPAVIALPSADDTEEVDVSDTPPQALPTAPIIKSALLHDGSVAVLIVRCDGTKQAVLIPPSAVL